MYANPQNGRQVVDAAPTLHVGTYRRALLAVIIGNPLFTDAEQLRANHAAHECQDAQRLSLWTRNVLRVAHEREAERKSRAELQAAIAQQAAQQPAAPTWATPSQCDEVYHLACLPCFTAGEKAATLRGLVALTQAGAVREIGSLYATALRRGAAVCFTDGSALSA